MLSSDVLNRVRVLAIAFLSPILLTLTAHAAARIVVLSPTPSTHGSPVFYEAYATSPNCAKGISAMRIYTAPHVNAYTTAGAHLETFIKLAPGSYQTVVQAWDNCGGIAKANVDLTVNADEAVSLFMPTSSSGSTAEHIAASAQNLSCKAGINAMRIYTADHTSPYTVHANHVDAFLNLLPGSYNITVQAWDNCGNVFKSSFAQKLSGVNDGNLYALTQFGDIAHLLITNGGLKNPNGSSFPPSVSAGTNPSAIAADPGGWFLYQVAEDGIYGFQIDQNTGALISMPGSPFPGKPMGSIVSVSNQIITDPNGNFVFISYFGSDTIAAYKIDRSTGRLTNTATFQLGGGPGSGVLSLSTDFSGKYLYAIRQNVSPTASQIVAYSINQDTGALTPVPGSPFNQNGGGQGFALTATDGHLYAGDRVAFGTGGIFAYDVNFDTGTLKLISGSPFPDNDIETLPQSIVGDVLGKHLWSANTSGFPDFKPWFTTLDILNGGSLGATTKTDSPHDYGLFTQDHSGLYLYGTAASTDPNTCPNGCAIVGSFRITSTGEPVVLSTKIEIGRSDGTLAQSSIVATRKVGD